MSAFRDIAMAMGDKNGVDIEAKIKNLEAQKKLMDEAFNTQLAQAKTVQIQQKSVQDQMKSEEKIEKIKYKLAENSQQNGSNVAVGGSFVDEFAGNEEATDASGLPILDGIA